MQNTPFRLLDSPQAIAVLRQSLAQVGLFEAVASEGYETANPYHPLVCALSAGGCPIRWS